MPRKCVLVTIYAKNVGGGFIEKIGVGKLVFEILPLLIPASGKPLYTNDAVVNKEKSSIECTMNDDTVRTPHKNPLLFNN